jgi:hypothetical protein
MVMPEHIEPGGGLGAGEGRHHALAFSRGADSGFRALRGCVAERVQSWLRPSAACRAQS